MVFGGGQHRHRHCELLVVVSLARGSQSCSQPLATAAPIAPRELLLLLPGSARGTGHMSPLASLPLTSYLAQAPPPAPLLPVLTLSYSSSSPVTFCSTDIFCPRQARLPELSMCCLF